MIRVELQTTYCEAAPELTGSLPEKAGDFRLARFRMTQGKQAGCELILVDFGGGRLAICPTRGMSLWKAELDSIPCQWNSPVRGPIHPSLVPMDDPSGIGWLDGFDELLVRCGLRSFGAPDFDPSGRLLFPLHGRIGNTPAEKLQIELDVEQSMLVITAEVYETRFLIGNLRLRVQYRLRYDHPRIEIHDRVTNLSSSSATMQLLYHINLGQPLLGEGSQLLLAANQIAARDSRAAQDLNAWHSYLGPTSGYAEQVYFCQPIADSQGWAQALLVCPDRSRGAMVSYKTDSLPYFTQWKNTAALEDGYVTGLEPATGYPNPHSVEKQQGRTVELSPGESRDFELVLEATRQPHQIAHWSSAIQSLQGKLPPTLDHHFC